MKKLVSICLFLISIGGVLFGQSWTYSNRIFSTDDVSAIQTTSYPGGSIITLGTFYGELNAGGTILTSYGLRDYFIVSFSENGEIEWTRQLGGNSLEYVLGGICTSIDGGIYVTGSFRNDLNYTPTNSISSAGLFDIFLAKFDSDGTVLWCKNIGSGATNQRATSLIVDNTGNVIIGGFFTDSITINATTTLYSDNGFDDYFYSKFDMDGELLWAKQAKALESNLSGRILAIDATDNSYYFSGIFGDSIAFETDTIVSKSNSYDIQLFKTTLDGNVEWIRKIAGKADDQSYGIVADDNDNIYLSGYYLDTDSLLIDENDTDTVFSVGQHKGDSDFLVAKYNSNGTLQWFRTNGGKGGDKLNDISLSNNNLSVGGYFSDTLMWGGIEISTNGLSDVDMFVGELDTDGNYRTANSFGGQGNSLESARSIFYEGATLYNIIRSNSEILILGDSIYATSGGFDYIVFGAVGCLPISIDNTIYQDIEGCYGDHTGYIQIEATGGFGAPWVYSIDNNQTSSSSNYFPNLAAGDYQVVVIDKEGCTQTGPLVTLTQPDTLAVTYTKTDIMVDTAYDDACTITIIKGSITAAVTGGSQQGIEYVLYPGGILQDNGTFLIEPGDSGRYIIRVDDSNNCGPVRADSIEVLQFGAGGDCVPLGIEDGLEDQAKVYPNPTSGIFTLEMPSDKAECSMEVLNMSGQVVLQQQLYPSSGKIVEIIDLSNMPKGLYLIRVDERALQSAIVVQ